MERTLLGDSLLPITARTINTILTQLQDWHHRGTDVRNLMFLIPYVVARCGVSNPEVRARLLRVLMPLARKWSVVIAHDPSLAGHDRSDEIERGLFSDYFDPDGDLLSDDEEEMVREIASIMYSVMAFTVHHLEAFTVHHLDREQSPPAPPQQQNLLRTPAVPRELNQDEEVARQRAGQRREARKARAEKEHAQASRSAVQVSDDALREVEERAAALELAAAAAAAGQGSSGRRARTPPPVRTADEEAAEELAREEEKQAEAARLRNEKADARKKQQEEWLAKQRSNKKGKGKGKALAAAPTEPQEPQERLPAPPRVDYAQLARDAIEERPRRAGRRG